MDYINNQESELKERLRRLLSPARFHHSLATQKMAAELVLHYGLNNLEGVSIASLLHDCGKCLSTEEARVYIERFKIDLDAIEREEPELWHGPIGEEMCRREFGIRDEEILRAIRFHSTAQAPMSATAKMVYLADYIEPHRHYRGRDQILKLAFKDVDLACLAVLNHKLSLLLHKKVLIHPNSIEARNTLVKEICASKGL